MRDFREYSASEWFRAKPLVHGFKQLRNDTVNHVFLKRRLEMLEHFLEETKTLEGKNIAMIVAFNQPWVIHWLLRMAARHVKDATCLIFDNSRQPLARSEIETLCRHRNIPYLALPANPARNPCRSHGIAMNWIVKHVVRAIKPRLFAFIDHDLIPLEKIELSKILGDQPFYGAPDVTPWGWSLWAGYCIYRFSTISQLPLNFNHDIPRGLDTGGRNWKGLYQNYDRSKLRFAEVCYRDVVDPADGTRHAVSVLDGRWIHLCGAGYHDRFESEIMFYERIEKATDNGVTLTDLMVSEPVSSVNTL